MLSEGTPIYVELLEEDDQRTLFPAVVLEENGNVITVEIEEEDLLPRAGQSIFVYYDTTGTDFTQQPARIDAVMDSSARLVIGVVTCGDPVDAENRQCFRVSTATTDLTAQVGPDGDCPLQDVSATGFSVIVDQPYKIGSVVDASIRFEDEQFKGPIRVQGARDVSRGKKRYGLHCIDDKYTNDNLQKGLQRITMAVQRTQLKRFRRSG